MEGSGGVGNGYYGDSQGSGDQKPSGATDDFEEYMWMANEEEAEKEMLKQIENDQEAQRCFAEMLEEEERLRAPDTHNAWQQGQVGWSSGCPPESQPNQSWNAPPTTASEGDALASNIQSLSVNDKAKVQLNPMAAEFVPGQAFQPSSG